MTNPPKSTRPDIAAGLSAYGRLRGPERAEGMRNAIDGDTVGASMTALSMAFVFGQIWSRDGLDAKQRSLVTIGILIALRQTDELKNHIHIGLTNGLTAREIEEATIQASAYAGFPAARVASNALVEVLHAQNILSDAD
jgi:4-carboxymuconolactone decarboxylase